MNWTLDLHAWPLPEEKVHMLDAQPGVMLTKPWPLPQSILTELEPGMVTASHHTLEPLYHVTAKLPLSESQGHGHSQLSLATATPKKAARTTRRSAQRAP